MDFNKIYVLDTNIILNDANNLYSISQGGSNLIVLPETVIDELDSKKSGFDEINYQAREFARILSDAKVISNTKIEDTNIMRISVDDILIDIISMTYYNLNNVEPSVINDRKIIKIAEFSTSYYNTDTILLSLDVMCRTRAISMGVNVESLSYKKTDKDYEFIKEIDIDSTLLHTIALKPIQEFDPEYKKENYCYIFKAETGHKVMAYILNERIYVIDENDLRRQVIKPKNLGQQFALSGMLDTNFNVCLIEAIAGSGKTLLALSSAMRSIDLGKYNKIIYIRNSIESLDKGEDVGYLSGNDEKFRIYNMPLYDTLEFIARQSTKKIENSESDEVIESKVKDLMEKYNIETTWIGEMRGRTLSNAFVIVDEVQNFSRKSLQTVLSRLDDDCKVICIGSNRQIDNQWVNKYTNGLSVLLDASLTETPELNMFATKLDKVVRGRITEWTERIFTK